MSRELPMTFIDLCVHGDVLLDDIDNFVQEWHSKSTNSKLHEFLGMTQDEYSLWVADSNALAFIVTAHKRKIHINEMIREIETLPLAARTSDPIKALALNEWIKNRQGKRSK